MALFNLSVRRAVSCDSFIGRALVVCASVLSVSACAPDHNTAQQRALLMEQIEKAKAMDSEHLANGTTDPTQAAESVYQARRAQSVVERLHRGEELPQSEIDNALDVPPQSISRDARSELIRELMTAEKRDELGEQTHGPGNDWLAWDSYREHRHRAHNIMKALVRGEEVPWSEIQQALRVPEFQ